MNKYFTAILLCVACLLPTVALGQGATTFSVSPTIFDMTASPGQVWKSTVRIINANPYELRLYIDVVNFAPKGESGTPQFLPVDEYTDPNSTLAQWISTDKEIIVAAEQTVELPLTITLPATAAPGGHFAALMISTKPADKPGESAQVQTSQVISSLVFLRVSGDISENSSIRSFRTSNYILSKPEATFELRIENRGNVHVQPQGDIKIYNMWGQERGTIPVNQQTLFGNVLPNSVRKYSFTWSSEWSVTDIGRYTAVATLAYGTDGRQALSADTAFWIIPWKILLTIFVIVGSFITLITWAIKMYVRHMLKMAGITPGNHIPVSAVESIAIATKTKRKKVSVVAPLEAGILDLRSRLKQTGTLQTYAKTILVFIRSYWKFFSVLAAVLVFIIVVTLFLKGAFTPSRDFEVTIEGEGHNVTVTNDDMKIEATQPEPITTTTEDMQSLPITLVNRSGVEALTQDVRRALEAAGYTIADIENDFGTIEDTTVVVYDPSFADDALAISSVLGNAPLSAFTTAEGEKPEVVIYIGTDAEVTQ
jgi:hypothetical protein